MAENDLKQLQKELKFKKLQLNSIYELSSAIHSQFDIDHVIQDVVVDDDLVFDHIHGLLRENGVRPILDLVGDGGPAKCVGVTKKTQSGGGKNDHHDGDRDGGGIKREAHTHGWLV